MIKKIILALLLFAPFVSAQAKWVQPIDCSTKVATNQFNEGDALCVFGQGYEPESEVSVHLIGDKNSYTDGEQLTPIASQTFSISTNGILTSFGSTLHKVADALFSGVYDIIVSLKPDTTYDEGDVIYKTSDTGIEVAGSEDEQTDAPPEVPEFSTLAAAAVLAGAGLIISRRK